MNLKAVNALEEIIKEIKDLQAYQDRAFFIARGKAAAYGHGDVIIDPRDYPEGGPFENLDFWQGWKDGWREQNQQNLLIFYRAVIAGRVPNQPEKVRVVRKGAILVLKSILEYGWEVESEPSNSEDVYRIARCELK